VGAREDGAQRRPQRACAPKAHLDLIEVNPAVQVVQGGVKARWCPVVSGGVRSSPREGLTLRAWLG